MGCFRRAGGRVAVNRPDNVYNHRLKKGLGRHGRTWNLGGRGPSRVDLREYWIVVLKRKWTILTFFVILVTSVAIGTLRQPKIYRPPPR